MYPTLLARDSPDARTTPCTLNPPLPPMLHPRYSTNAAAAAAAAAAAISAATAATSAATAATIIHITSVHWALGSIYMFILNNQIEG